MNIQYVTVSMLAKHAKKSRAAVHAALAAAGIKGEIFPGKRGKRIPVKVAARFVVDQWPEAGPLKLPQ